MKALSWLIPYRKLTIDSRLSRDEVFSVIRSRITDSSEFLFPRARDIRTPYMGYPTDKGFKIHRVIRHKNSFLPIILANIEPIEKGTQVTIMMRPHLFTVIFMTIWLTFCIAGAVTSICFTVQQGFGPHLYMPVAAFGFGLALMDIAFGVEAWRSERWFREILPPIEDVVHCGPFR